MEKHGKEQVQIWRRSFDIPPPELSETDERHPRNDKRYKDISAELLPKTEVKIPSYLESQDHYRASPSLLEWNYRSLYKIRQQSARGCPRKQSEGYR